MMKKLEIPPRVVREELFGKPFTTIGDLTLGDEISLVC